MKSLAIIANFAILLTIVSCEPDSSIFTRIGSYTSNGKVKIFYTSGLLKDTWMNAYMFCGYNNLELLRIEDLEEYKVFIRSVKLNWLDLDDKMFVDGKNFNRQGWKFLSNDSSVLNRTIYDISTKNSNEGENLCMSLNKNTLKPKIAPTNCEQKLKFICQDIKDSNYQVSDSGPIVVDVPSRIMYEVGNMRHMIIDQNYFSLTYYENRNYVLSQTNAFTFCKDFGMELYQVWAPGQLRSNQRNLLTNFTSQTTSNSSKSRLLEPPKLDTHVVTIIDEEFVDFFCEKRESEDELRLQVVNATKKQTIKNLVGMKTLGTLGDPNNKSGKIVRSTKTIYISDKIIADTWFRAHSFCKSLGMDLYSPEDNSTNHQLIELLKQQGYNQTVWVGGSQVGTEVFWYSTKSGVEIDFNNGDCCTNCLHLKHQNNHYTFDSFKCDGQRDYFVCEAEF